MLGTDFLNVAHDLVQGTREDEWRTAISRAYYAVFHFFRELFLANALDIGSGGQAHSSLYLGLNNGGFAAVEALAGEVDDLRKNRVRADYNLRATISQLEADRDVQRAEDILSQFQAVLTTTPVNQIVDGVRNYLQSIGRLGKP